MAEEVDKKRKHNPMQWVADAGEDRHLTGPEHATKKAAHDWLREQGIPGVVYHLVRLTERNITVRETRQVELIMGDQ